MNIKTKRRQIELDNTFNTARNNIEKIKNLCTFNSDEPECNWNYNVYLLFIFKKYLIFFNFLDEEFRNFQNQQLNKVAKPPQSIVCPTLAYSVAILTSKVEEFKSFFKIKQNEVCISIEIFLNRCSKVLQ